MEMDYVEAIRAARHAIERYKMIGEWILALGTETSARSQGALRIASVCESPPWKQGDFVPLTNKLFGEI